MAALAEELGIEVVGYQTDLYGPSQVAGADAVTLLQTMGPSDASPSSRGAGWRASRMSSSVYGSGHGCPVTRDRCVSGLVRGGVPGIDEHPAASSPYSGVGARRRRPAGVQRVDPPLALPPLEAKAIRVALGGGDLHGGAGKRLAVGLDDACLLETPPGEIEVPRVGRQCRQAAGGVDEHRSDAPAVTLGLPPRVTRQCVGQGLALDEVDRGVEERDSPDGYRAVTSLGGERDGPLHVDGHAGRHLVVAVARPSGKEGDPCSSTPIARRAACAVLNSVLDAASASNTQHAGPQSIARDPVGLVQRQIGDELDRPTRAIGREFVLEPVQPGGHGQQPHVDGPGHQRRRHARARGRLPERRTFAAG